MMRLIAQLAAILLGLSAVCAASDEPESRRQLQEKLRQLQNRVAELEAHEQSPPSPDPQDVARAVDQVVADAQRRSQFLFADEQIAGGFDLEKTKFFIRSEDGDFLLMPGFLFQVRDTTNYNTAGEDEVNNGLEIRRMRPIFAGHVFTPKLRYFFQGESNSSGGDLFLLDAWIRYQFADHFSFQVGQFKDPVHHEQIMADEFLLAADRSLINALVGGGQLDRVQGVMLMYDDQQHWRAQLAVHDGYNSKNTSFDDDGGGSSFIGVTPTNWGVSGRVEYFFTGTRAAYDQFTARKLTESLLVLGAGFDFSQGSGGDVLFHTVDLQYDQASGLGLYGALLGLWRDLDQFSNVPEGNYYDWGFLVQASQLVWRDKLEGFVRYDVTWFDDDVPAGQNDQIQELTIGMNYYWHGQNAKFTLDFTWLPNGSPTSVSGLGILAGDDNQFILRGQFQLFI